MQPFSSQPREQHFSKRNHEISVLQIYISRLELQRCSLEYVISFSKVYVRNFVLGFG
jgi:hypothetical protein